MKIAIIDADLVSRTKHRFPNLACMKISGYYKDLGHDVVLKTDYKRLDMYDKVFISKVFTDTPIDEQILELPNVEYGGTGFFYDKAPALPDEIEHHMPDYELYSDWVAERIADGGKALDFKYYTDYSIGYMTRGCFRKCEFCVNKNSERAVRHSALNEFFDSKRKKVCLLDDNFLACSDWRAMLQELKDCGKPFQFKQGLDERILTDEKCEMLFGSKYDGDYIFAFDNIADAEVIERKARLIRHYCKNKGHNIKFYVLCGFDREDKYDHEFWVRDVREAFERVLILAKYNFKPYIMRFEKYKTSPLYGTYVNLACWCNQPALFNNLSYRQFCEKDDKRKSGGKGTSATWRYFEEMLKMDKELGEYVDTVPKSLVLDYEEW